MPTVKRRHDTLVKDGSRRMEGQQEWTGQSMSSLLHIADDRDRWAVIAADAYVGVLSTTPERFGY